MDLHRLRKTVKTDGHSNMQTQALQRKVHLAITCRLHADCSLKAGSCRPKFRINRTIS